MPVLYDRSFRLALGLLFCYSANSSKYRRGSDQGVIIKLRGCGSPVLPLNRDHLISTEGGLSSPKATLVSIVWPLKVGVAGHTDAFE